MLLSLIVCLLPLLLGWVLDLKFGDPESLPHPVVWMGRWIACGEKYLNRGSHRMLKGALFVVCSIVLVYYLTLYLVSFAMIANVFAVLAFDEHVFPILHYEVFDYWGMSILYHLLCSVIVFYCLAGHTLRKEVRMVFEAVDRSVEDGRRQVARIVGRDTSELSAQECRTAALETLAENLSDGVIAPMFWFALLGIPGMVAYKMVNTFDSMVGYQNERYKDFGCWAARIDDVANYVPARLTAFLMIIAYKVMCGIKAVDKACEKSFTDLLRFVTTFGPKHASPNSGWPESALAGILDCRFGGPHNYFGEYFYKPFIGTNDRNLTTDDMRLSVRITFIAECLMVTLLVVEACCLMFVASEFL